MGAVEAMSVCQPVEVTGLFPTDGGKPINGAYWFRTTLDVPLHLAGQPGELDLGKIIDADQAYVNGVQVGSTGYRYPPRLYSIPPGVLKAGENTLVVRVVRSEEHTSELQSRGHL